MPVLKSACPLDCPDACSLDVKVENGRVVTIDGNSDNPITDGYICQKVRGFADHLYGPQRILHPAVRRGAKGDGTFERVSWDEALGLVADRLLRAQREQGGESILPYCYGGSNGFLSQDATDLRLFRRLGASRLARTVCAAPSKAAAAGLYGKMAGVAIEDYGKAKLVVLWGFNPQASGIHLIPHIQAATRKGATLVVIDPRRTRLAARADMHLAVRPGSDLAVALSLIHWLFSAGRAATDFLARHATGVEELRRRAEGWTFERAASLAGVEASALERFASLYADASPAVIRAGWGPERNRNGGSALASILALPAVAGKFGVRGGGYTMSNSGIWAIDSEAAVNEPPVATREINMNLLGETLLHERKPPVACLFVYNSNALMTSPAQEKIRAGLSREDLFTVVFDQVLTDTARYADVILPAPSFLERHEVSRGYGSMVLQESRAVIEPVGESRPNHEVFAALCRLTGVSKAGDPETGDEIRDAALGAGPDSARWKRDLEERRITAPSEGGTPIQFVDVFPRTPDLKVHLFPADLDAQAPKGLYGFQEDPATAEFPLALISPATERTINSSLGQLHLEQVPIEMNPADAKARGVKDGDAVRAHNSFGEVRCLARINPEIPEGVVSLAKGIWSHNTLNGRTANALAPDTLTDLGAGACFNDARVQVEGIAVSS
ncbi:MAG: molybdopterin-dependent oxidoreductase [Acidobacteria bacterium]|nr:molybdopterin-dependent oxidoreductase [Acidobacteriota bacterium]